MELGTREVNIERERIGWSVSQSILKVKIAIADFLDVK